MPLTTQEAAEQINQMKSFIIQEAEEKAMEIQAKAREEYNIEKQKLVRMEKNKISVDFERKIKNEDIKKRIARSHQFSNARLQILRAQDECIHKLTDIGSEKLVTITKNTEQYRILLAKLITQAMLHIGESEVEVTCRKSDVELVKSAINDAIQLFKNKSGKPDEKINVTPSTRNYLPEKSSGGVVVTGLGGHVVCDNTLDARLSLALSKNLPRIRKLLFPDCVRKIVS